MPSPTANLTGRPMGIAALAVILMISGAIGAYAHWILWHPMDGVLIFRILVDALRVRSEPHTGDGGAVATSECGHSS